MKKITLAVIFMLAVSGCVTGSRAVKPSPKEPGRPAPVSHEPAGPKAQVVSKKPIFFPVPKAAQKTERIEYSQITNLIREFIDMKETSAVPGQKGYLGISENKLIIFEIRGNKNNIKEASMKLVYPEGIDRANRELNNAMMLRFLKNAAPEFLGWQARAGRILDRFNSLKPGMTGIQKEDITLPDASKIIQVVYDKNASYIIVTLRPKP